MREFESIVMSQTEPLKTGTLWLRKKHNTIGPKPNQVPPLGMDIWYFSEKGWQPLFDADTRYNINPFYSAIASEEPIETEVVPNPEVGIVNINNTYNVYDGDRQLGANSNIVLEAGLKAHVDALMTEINQLKSRVSTLENTVSSQAASISALTSRISALESNP